MTLAIPTPPEVRTDNLRRKFSKWKAISAGEVRGKKDNAGENE